MAITTTVECDATLGIRAAKSFSDCQPAQLHVTFTTGKNAVCRCWIKDAEGRAFALGLSTTGLILCGQSTASVAGEATSSRLRRDG